jgi:ABC-type amino acid transport substrate-binding protein
MRRILAGFSIIGLSALLIATAIATSAGGAVSTAKAPAAKATHAKIKVLRAATDPTYRPLAFMQNGKLVGFDVEISYSLAKHMKVKLKMMPMAFDGIIPAINSGKVDTEPEMAITAKRAKVVDYTIPYFSQTNTTVLRANDGRNPTIAALKGMKVGVTAGTSAAALCEANGITPTQYNTTPDSFQDLILGRIDAVVIDSITAGYSVRHTYPSKLRVSKNPLTGRIGIGGIVKKGNKPLLREMNQAIRQMKRDGSLKRIIKKWFGDTT